MENYCLHGRAIQLLQYIVSASHSLCQLCYRGHTCCQRECLVEQGGLNTGDCYISSLQESKAYETCFRPVICENPWVNPHIDPCQTSHSFLIWFF